jgi:putative Holliday junction resolvase
MVQTFIGFDVGKKRTGIAIGNDLTCVASGIDAYFNHKNGSTNWEAVEKVLTNYKPNKVIVGVPYNADGSTQEMTFIAKSFARKLTEKFAIEHILIDEFLSSNEAKKQLKYNHYHKNAKRCEVDKKSAEIILQDFLNSI